MHNIGDFIFDTIKNLQVKVIDKSDVWGFVSYKVWCPIDNSIYKLSEEQISDEAVTYKNDIYYLRYITLLAKIKNETAIGILSSLSSGIIPLPHQFHVLNRALSNNNIRYILADEVGLGKTIEAGLIIKELKARGLVKRVLIVCPKGLVTQWEQEMKENFNEKFHMILPEDYDTIRKLSDSEDVYGQFEQVISPMDSIKPLERRAGWNEEKIAKHNDERINSIINSGWDLVVIDEAHRVAGSSGEVARYKLGNLLSSASPYLLLLTATPHNGKTEPFLRLIRLIDEKAFPNFKAIVKEQVAPYVIRTEKREAIDDNGEKLFKSRLTKVVEISWDERHTLQRELYELTTEYVSKGYNKAMRNKGKNMWLIFLLIMMQRMVTSSTAAIRTSLEKRLFVLDAQDFKLNNITEQEFAELEIEENMDDAISSMSVDIKAEIAELTAIVATAKQAEFQYLDAKIEPFLKIVDNLFSDDKDIKIIVFTEFVATQNYISKLLNDRKYKTSLLNGSMSIDERNDVLGEFKKVSNILISTDAGGEGLNLQFSNVVINFDLPWNPMKIEQRIGRVDRIGQKRDVQVYNFVLTETVENRVRDVLEQKLSVILEEVGIDKYSDVLDSEFAALNFTDSYIKSLKDPKSIEYYLNPIEEELKTQVKNAKAFKDLIKEEKDLTDLIGVSSNFDLETSIMQMVNYYDCWKGQPSLPTNIYSINDKEIIKHLNANILHEDKDNWMIVSVKNFPNEKGYFMLWELNISEDIHSKRIISVFINNDFVLRPMAGKKIWEAMASTSSAITINKSVSISSENIDKLNSLTLDFAYEVFVDMQKKYTLTNEENYKKYLYALNLRIEAANNIGIDNIKRHRLVSLHKEKTVLETQHKTKSQLCPEFNMVFACCLEE